MNYLDANAKHIDYLVSKLPEEITKDPEKIGKFVDIYFHNNWSQAPTSCNNVDCPKAARNDVIGKIYRRANNKLNQWERMIYGVNDENNSIKPEYSTNSDYGLNDFLNSSKREMISGEYISKMRKNIEGLKILRNRETRK